MGKSSLLTLLTGTESEAAAYEFTTLTCIPGVIHYNDSKIQVRGAHVGLYFTNKCTASVLSWRNEFTTLTCIPGVIHYNDSNIQVGSIKHEARDRMRSLMQLKSHAWPGVGTLRVVTLFPLHGTSTQVARTARFYCACRLGAWGGPHDPRDPHARRCTATLQIQYFN